MAARTEAALQKEREIVPVTEYVIIAGETLPVSTEDEISAAERALSEAGINQTHVWRSPHPLEWIRENGDPDGVETDLVLLADTNVDPVANGTEPPILGSDLKGIRFT